MVPPAASPSCSAASCPASDSCAPPLRSSPASSTRRPRCATSTRLSNSSIPHRQVNYAAARRWSRSSPQRSLRDLNVLFFFCRKFICGLTVWLLDQRVKKKGAKPTLEDASAFSAGWVLRPQGQICLRARVDRWVLAGQHGSTGFFFFSQNQPCSHVFFTSLRWFNKSDKSHPRREKHLPTRLLIYKLGVIVLSGVASAPERSDVWEGGETTG